MTESYMKAKIYLVSDFWAAEVIQQGFDSNLASRALFHPIVSSMKSAVLLVVSVHSEANLIGFKMIEAVFACISRCTAIDRSNGAAHALLSRSSFRICKCAGKGGGDG